MFSRRRAGPEGPPSPGLAAGRRTLILLLAVAVVGAPAGVLRAFCAGHSCDEPANASSEVPFCSLPAEVRTRIAAGFREGRSPDVLAVSHDSVSQRVGSRHVWWPTKQIVPSKMHVPLAFWGTGVADGVEIPSGAGLDDVAPTVESILGFDRPHPEVRSGTAIDGVASGEPPRLVVELVWVGRGTDDLEGAGRKPALRAALESGATLRADPLSLPLDPAAILTTIGTGGRPAQHGITGEIVRDDAGRLRKAWSPRSPVSVIATLGDDLDEEMRQEPVIGMAAARRAYLGAVGGNWHVDVDQDVFVKTARGDEPRDAAALLRKGFGTDDVPDLAVVAVEGGIEVLDATIRKVTATARKVSGGSAAFVLTATGSTSPGSVSLDREPLLDGEMADLVEATVPGGLFLDQEALAERQVSEDDVLRAVAEAKGAYGPLFADVFPAIAVSFGRYC